MRHAPVPALVGFLIALALGRGIELALSARHARTLAGAGAREFGAGHFPLLVAIHVLFPLAIVGEVLALGARPPALWPVFLAAWLAAIALRGWCMKSLGRFWNVRILVVPGRAPSRSGPYRWLAHPNYVAVAIELVATSLMFGAWRTALAFAALDALAMAVRIPAENRALAWAATAPGPAVPSTPSRQRSPLPG